MTHNQLLTPQTIDALQSIDLQLSFGNHGYPAATEDGYAVLAVTDREYTAASDAVKDLRSDRGDVFAQEAIDYRGDSPLCDTFSNLEWNIGSSPYMSKWETSLLGYYKQATQTGKPERILHDTTYMPLLEKLRQYRLIAPINYALGLAAVRDVQCTYAGITEDENRQFHEARDNKLLAMPGPVGLMAYAAIDTRVTKAEMEFRSAKTVARLGVIATEMEPLTDEKPVLRYMGGRTLHQQAIEDTLSEHDVPFTTTTFYSDRMGGFGKDTSRNVAHTALRFVSSSHDRYVKQWQANARTQSDH